MIARITRAFAPTTTYYDPTFAARAIGARTNNAGGAVTDVTAEEDRLIHAILTEGIVRPETGFLVQERQAGANMSVDVGSGTAKDDLAVIDGDNVGQEKYVVRLDDVSDNLTIEAADPTLDRIDEVYLVVLDDPYDSNGSLSLPRLAVRKGDAAGSPSPPGPDSAWDASLLLASVAVGAAVTSITDADITDARVFTSAAVPLVPTGTVLPYAGSAAPTGYLLAQGQAVSRTTYARLFGVIGTTYGVGDGSTTFNIPDLRQRFPLGKAASGTGSTLGGTGGSVDHTHTGPSHTHTGPSHVHTMPTHTHSVNPPATNSGASTVNTTFTEGTTQVQASLAVGSHVHSVDIASFTSGATDPGDTNAAGTGATGASGTGATGTGNPPFIALNYIVRI